MNSSRLKANSSKKGNTLRPHLRSASRGFVLTWSTGLAAGDIDKASLKGEFAEKKEVPAMGLGRNAYAEIAQESRLIPPERLMGERKKGGGRARGGGYRHEVHDLGRGSLT